MIAINISVAIWQSPIRQFSSFGKKATETPVFEPGQVKLS